MRFPISTRRASAAGDVAGLRADPVSRPGADARLRASCAPPSLGTRPAPASCPRFGRVTPPRASKPDPLRVALVTGLAVGSLLAWVGGAAGITFLDTNYGTPSGPALGRAAAMGATGVAQLQGSEAVVQNPALLALEAERVRLDFLAGVTQATEDRMVPLFDSFNSFVDETTIASNRNTYADAQGGVTWRLPADVPMALAAGVFDRYDFDYDYFEEVREPSPFAEGRDLLLGQRTLAVDGVLRALSAGYGAEIVKNVHLGLSVHRYFGSVDYLARIDSTVTGGTTRTTEVAELERDLAGWGWSMGGHASVGPRFDVGVSFEGPVTVSGTHRVSCQEIGPPAAASTTSTEAEIEYPGSLRFGISFRPQNVLATQFAVEAVRQFWNDLDDTFDSSTRCAADIPRDTLALHDTWEFRVGLEHLFYNQLPVRFGFRYLENYADAESDRSIFSLGVGYTVQSIRIDASALYQRQTSRQDFLFDPNLGQDGNGNQFVSPNSDTKVEDSVLRFVVGISAVF